jgi:hypothetical protein
MILADLARLRSLLPRTALLSALLLAGACARAPWIEDPVAMQGDDVIVRAAGAGRHRFTVLRSPQSPPLTALTCRNAGPGLLEQVRFWGLGGRDLADLNPDSGQAPEPFRLLPGEKLTLSQSGGEAAGRPSLLTGVLGWEWPPEAADGAAPRWPGLIVGAAAGADGAIAFQETPGTESRLELALDSPIPIRSLRVGWSGGLVRVPPSSSIDVWVGDDQGRWVRAAHPAAVDVQRPFEIPAAAGRKDFRLRLSWRQGLGGPTPPVLRRIRIEREFQAPGRLRLLPAGASEIRFAFAAPAEAAAPEASAMELHLLALPAL